MMGRRSSRAESGASGFVLVAVLAALVILSLMAATIATVAQRARDQQLERQRSLSARIDMMNTRATVLFLLTSQRMTFGGLTVDAQVKLTEDEQRDAQAGDVPMSNTPVGNEILLDGSTHKGLGAVAFALQDDRGLLAVNWSPAPMVEKFLYGQAVPPLPMATLANRLLDYQDPDDLYRLNSLEADGYAALGLPAPSNRTVVTPLELRAIPGWTEALAGKSDAELLGTLTTVRSPILNINTAPPSVLQAFPGIDQGLAQRILALRALRPFVRVSEVADVLGGRLDYEEMLSLYPSGSGTLTLWSPEGGVAQVMHWTLTPRDEGGRPWREDYEFSFPTTESDPEGAPRTVASPLFAESAAPDE